MIWYELKKIFLKPMNQAAMAVLIAAVVIVSMLTINNVEYVDENGAVSTGIAAARNLRKAKNQWAGYLTGDVLAQVIKENNAVNASKEAISDDYHEQDKFYAKKQGFQTINNLISQAFSPYNDYDYFRVDSVTAKEVEGLYDKRISAFTKWLDSGEETFTDAQKAYVTTQYKKLETPFYYEYEDGWKNLLQSISTFILILALVIGFLVSGIFSSEFQLKADSIFFSAKLGRSLAVLSKQAAGLLVTTVLYVVFVLLYTGIVLMVLGADGAKCPIQLDMWNSCYNLTYFQAYLLITAGGYIGTLFAATLAMIVSAKTHSTVTAIIVPFILLCMFPFLSRIISQHGAAAFFPDQLLEVYVHIKHFVLYEAWGRVRGSVEVLLPVYLAACIVLQPVLYGIYKRTQMK